MRSTAQACPAHLYDDPEAKVEDRVICVREPSIRRAWGFICESCLIDMLNGRARRNRKEARRMCRRARRPWQQ